MAQAVCTTYSINTTIHSIIIIITFRLEVALRQLDPDVSVPYWDSTLDEGLPTPRDAILWTDAFFGGNNGTITSGPFANWVATHELGFVPSMKTLYRDVGTSPFGGLFKESDIEFAMSRERFEDFTACVDPTFELVHGVVHMFVGGYMADSKCRSLSTSTIQDPHRNYFQWPSHPTIPLSSCTIVSSTTFGNNGAN